MKIFTVETHKRRLEELAQWQARSDIKATNKNGDEWTGETELDGHEFWHVYKDSSGNLYQSRETPCVRLDFTALDMDALRAAIHAIR